MLTELDLACGFPLGHNEEGIEPLPRRESGQARAVLEKVLEDILAESSQTLVAFSGGLDSSAILALATHVARRRGLPLPVPATLRFPEIPETHEDDWQNSVIEHVRPADWLRIELNDELDVVGHYALRLQTAHPRSWPSNAHLVAPILEASPGATVLTGVDGDGLLGSWRWATQHRLLREPWRVRRGDARSLAASVAPRWLRAAAVERRVRTESIPAWLTPDARMQFQHQMDMAWISEPLAWRRWVQWYAGQLYLAIAVEALSHVADLWEGRIRHPLLDRGFLGALASSGPAHTRADGHKQLIGDLLPASFLRRTSKASFNDVFFGPQSLTAVEAWTGGGVDERFVDVEALRYAWRALPVDARSQSLLQDIVVAELAKRP